MKARLPKGEIVVFSHTLVHLARMTLLVRGTRLLVEHDLGRVVSASTNLSQSQTGVVTTVQRRPESASYGVNIEHGGTMEIAKDKIQPHPNERPLLIHAVLDLQFDGRALTTVRLVKETAVATITSANPG